jgi:hypothetical protein
MNGQIQLMGGPLDGHTVSASRIVNDVVDLWYLVCVHHQWTDKKATPIYHAYILDREKKGATKATYRRELDGRLHFRAGHVAECNGR